MAGPLNGIGGQPQIPLSQPFQPGNNANVREQENRQQDSGTVAKAAYSNASNVQETRESRPVDRSFTVSRSDSSDTSAKRGSIFDITV